MVELRVFETLSTMAEVSISFLGFTGVVGIFAGRSRDLPAVSLRLWVMVGLALVTLLLCFLPSVLHHLGARGQSLWASCSATIVVLSIGHFIFVVPTVIRERRAGRWSSFPIVDPFPVFFIGCVMTQVLNALGIVLERTSGGYVLGLYLLLAANGINFIALLVALRAVDSHAAEQSAAGGRGTARSNRGLVAFWHQPWVLRQRSAAATQLSARSVGRHPRWLLDHGASRSNLTTGTDGLRWVQTLACWQAYCSWHTN